MRLAALFRIPCHLTSSTDPVERPQKRRRTGSPTRADAEDDLGRSPPQIEQGGAANDWAAGDFGNDFGAGWDDGCQYRIDSTFDK